MSPYSWPLGCGFSVDLTVLHGLGIPERRSLKYCDNQVTFIYGFIASFVHRTSSQPQDLSALSENMVPLDQWIIIFPSIFPIKMAILEGIAGIFPMKTWSTKVTLVAMLSVPSAYVGGRSCFRRAQSSRGHRELSLEQGDVVTWMMWMMWMAFHQAKWWIQWWLNGDVWSFTQPKWGKHVETMDYEYDR